MKKAKLILAAIAVMAVAGGVFASKATRSDDFIYVPTTLGGACTFKSTGLTLIGTGTFTTRFASSTTTTTCTTLPVYTAE